MTSAPLWLARRVAGRTPTLLLLLAWTVTALVHVLVALWRRPPVLGALVVLGGLAWAVLVHGWVAVAVTFAAVVVVLGFVAAYWSTYAPASWQRRLAGPVRSAWRACGYRRSWDEAMGGCGLVRDGIVPTLMSCRTSNGVDRLSVHLAPGQIAADWRELAPRIASALGVRSVRVRADGPRDVLLLVRWREVRWRDHASAAEIDLEIAETVDQPGEQPETPGPFPRRSR